MKPIIFSEGDPSGFQASCREAMGPPITHFEKDLLSLRTGKASTKLLDGIKVECYGQLMGLRELCTMAAPDARLLTVQPWDKANIDAVEKAIAASDLGINPVNDGTVIRLQFPMMSTDRREELVKVLGKKTEEAKIGVRNVRKEFHNQLRDAEKKKLVSEDFAKRLNDLLQKITDEFSKKVDELSEKKAKELRSF